MAVIDWFLVCPFVFACYSWAGNGRDCMDMFFNSPLATLFFLSSPLPSNYFLFLFAVTLLSFRFTLLTQTLPHFPFFFS